MFTINGDIIDVKAGDCLKVEPGQYYEILNSSEDTQAVIQFSNANTDSNNSTTFNSLVQ